MVFKRYIDCAILFSMNKSRSKKRVYICHTYYHAYIAAVKELVKGSSHYGESDLILSTMSNDFGSLKERAESSGIFGSVYMFDEKEDVTFPEVMHYHRDRGNIVLNLLQRIKYTRLLGKMQEPYVPADLSGYEDVYVFCDSDPIGYYLNYKKIPYHAIEDGLNSGLLDDQAYLSNKGAFRLKCFMAKLGLIFIESGYSRYCMDYEVNDISVNKRPPQNIIECRCEDMYKRLTESDHMKLVRLFLEEADTLLSQLNDVKQGNSGIKKPFAMILTEPLCELDVRKKLFGDIIDEYSEEHTVIIKPHPRDILDYEKEFPDTVVIKGKFPMEVMNDIPGFRVEKLISVITQIDNITFADELIYLGLDFLDRYEPPEVHRKNE